MFRRRRGARASDGTCSPLVAPDRTVHTAEKFVRRAWALELARWRDRQEFALQIEHGNRDAALALLAAAQRDGDPRQISAARAVVLQALDDVRAAVTARDDARRLLRRELRLLTRKPKRLAAGIGLPRNRRRRVLRRLVRWWTPGLELR